MLYVFFVDTGTMMTFDMNLALENVSALQHVIEKTCALAIDKQVLLISGGLTLDPAVKVCKYGAGTDTNPIFLFTKYAPDDEFSSFGQSISDSDIDMKERVDAFENMAADYHTLAARSQLAREFSDMANQEQKLCNQLVDSQHRQQLGWAAVVANLEDSTIAFKRHAEMLETESKQYFKSRPMYQNLLKKFHEAADLLAKIPLLPSLVLQHEKTGETSSEEHTLLTRFCSEPRDSLDRMADQCKKWIEQFNEETLSVLNNEVCRVLNAAEDPSMKEVKGIEDRLYRLNQLMDNARKCANDQFEYAEALNVHHNRISSTNDLSVLSDLCRTHQMHLIEMLKNHKCLKDIRERCMKAKFELSENLQTRIKWVSWIQNQMFSLNNRLAIYRENLRRLSDHLDMIQQIHHAPTVYAKTVTEIQRRKIFSTNFFNWASALSEQALKLNKTEVLTRNVFQSGRSENFVNSLFSGMEDLPPPFATECPKGFDLLLPTVGTQYLEKLKNDFPELACFIEIFPPDAMPQVLNQSLVSDSVCSSDIPSPKEEIFPTASCQSLSGNVLFKTENITTLACSENHLTAEQLNSPTSSPFEEPFMQDANIPLNSTKKLQELKTDDVVVLDAKKKIYFQGAPEKEIFSPIVEEQNHFESDGEEFECVDSLPKLCELPFHSKESYSDQGRLADAVNFIPCQQTPGNFKSQLSSPGEECLKSPDSMTTSHDFHPTDYFIDDSMPSSYTESTGTSAQSHGNQMVKSHHIIVAELQQQMDAKNSVILEALGSPLMSQSNILKLQCTISALQEQTHEVCNQMKYELAALREHILSQRLTISEEIANVTRLTTDIITADANQSLIEKASAIEDAILKEQIKYKEMLDETQHNVDVKSQKLNDALEKIEMYHEQILQYNTMLNDLKSDFKSKLEQAELNFSQENEEKIRSMVLEHELEIESLQETFKQAIQKKDEIISSLQQTLSENQTQLQMINIEKENVESDIQNKIKREQELWMENMETEYLEKQKIAVFKALEEQHHAENSEIERLQFQLDTIKNENQETIKMKGNVAMGRGISKGDSSLTVSMDFRDKFQADSKCKEEIEMMRSRFKLAYSTTCIEKLSTYASRSPPSEGDYVDYKEELLIAQKMLKQKEEAFQAEKNISENEHKEQIERLKASHIAENQISFNEAISIAVQEKDKLIRDLESKVDSLKLQNKNVDRTDSLPYDCVESVQECSQFARADIGTPSGVICRSVDFGKDLDQEKISVDLINKFDTKLSNDQKLSVLTCDPGDIVLFCYDEKHENYVAFHFRNIPHFLMPESLNILKLEIPPQTSKASWATAIVLSKEYCQAKKESNRYKVPKGTTFYRVRVKPWPEEGLKQVHESRAELTTVLQTTSCYPGITEVLEENSKSKAMSTSTI